MLNKFMQSASLALIFTFSSTSIACLNQEQEVNDTLSDANSGLCSDVTIAGELTTGDIDWYRFDVSSSGTIAIELNHHYRDDFDWTLYDSNATEVAAALTSSVPESGSYQSTSSGTYYLKLIRYAGRGWYDLTINYPDATTPPPANCSSYGTRPSKPGELRNWLSGNAEDQCANLDQGAVLLMGGGSDVDASFSQRVKPHIGESKDIVVLRSSGSNGYNDYLLSLLNADSVETLLLDSRAKADSDYADWVIRTAEFVFVAGGDQSDYLNLWTGTKTQGALQSVYDKGGVIGGTSAGMALMAGNVYDPDGVAGAVSSEVVTDFCHASLNFSNAFVNIPFLSNALTDTHFYERDRMGRAMVSLAHHNSGFINIAASENSAIFITQDGVGVVDGGYEVYVLRQTSQTSRTQLACGEAVIFENVIRTRLLPSDTYNFNTHSHTGSELSISIDGRNSNFYTPTNVY